LDETSHLGPALARDGYAAASGSSRLAGLDRRPNLESTTPWKSPNGEWLK
jgi:hypothetical protein